MKLRYRLAVRDGLYYPQVNIRKYMFWTGWNKIAKHVVGYGLYNYNMFDEPGTTVEKATQMIRDFDAWYKKEKSLEVTYINLYQK